MSKTRRQVRGANIWDTVPESGARLALSGSPGETLRAPGTAEASLEPGPTGFSVAPPARHPLPTHCATAGEQVDYVVVERRNVVGDEDPDALIPESGVLLPSHEPQHRTHGPHHEPGDAGSAGCSLGPSPALTLPAGPGLHLRKTLSGKAQLTRKTWIPRKRRRTRRQNPTGA